MKFKDFFEMVNGADEIQVFGDGKKFAFRKGPFGYKRSWGTKINKFLDKDITGLVDIIMNNEGVLACFAVGD